MIKRTHRTGRILLKDYMTPLPHAIEPHETLDAASRRMGVLGVYHLPVRAAGKVVGIITDRDILLSRAMAGVDPANVEVGTVMTDDPFVAKEGDELRAVADAMLSRRIGSAIVVDAAGHLVGIFTVTDALKALIALT